MASIPVNPSTEESSWKLGFSCSVCLKASALRLLASMSRRSGAGCAGRCAGFGNYQKCIDGYGNVFLEDFKTVRKSGAEPTRACILCAQEGKKTLINQE